MFDHDIRMQDVCAEMEFDQPISRQIWADKYRWKDEETILDTWSRVADTLSSNEAASKQRQVAETFRLAMQDFRLLPAGRILAGCGTGRDVTLYNTFVMRTLPDSVSGIMDTMKDAALTMKMGGGLGFDFSTIRPAGFRGWRFGMSGSGAIGSDGYCKFCLRHGGQWHGARGDDGNTAL